ncbi:MAG: hypothetical protein ACP5UV_01650, partial [Thermoplasmata archaeon]
SVNKIAKETGKTIGEITNDAYRTFLGSIENVKSISQNFMEGAKSVVPRYIDNFKNLEISGKDLRDFGQKVSFRNIEELIFTDVSEEDFEKYVAYIDGVKVLKIPKSIRKATAIKKSTFVDKIEQE